MAKNWRGIEILESNLVFLVDFKNREYKQVGTVNSDTEEGLRPFVEKYRSLLEKGMWLFTADKLKGNEYEASHRLSYANWMVEGEEANDYTEEEKKFPFYWDSAESDERVRFSSVVNGTGVCKFDGTVVHKPMTPKEMKLDI